MVFFGTALGRQTQLAPLFMNKDSLEGLHYQLNKKERMKLHPSNSKKHFLLFSAVRKESKGPPIMD